MSVKPFDETMKVWCVMQVLRQLPEERAHAREVLNLVNDLAPMYGYETPAALLRQLSKPRPAKGKKAGRVKAG